MQADFQWKLTKQLAINLHGHCSITIDPHSGRGLHTHRRIMI